MKDLILLCTENGRSSLKGEAFEWIDGMATISILNPNLANTFLGIAEQIVLDIISVFFLLTLHQRHKIFLW